MAQGDLVFFNSYVDGLGKGVHNMDTDVIKFAWVNNATVPSATTADPRWGAGGTTNFKTNETTGTGYTTDGEDIAATYVTTGAAGKVDATDQVWTKNAAGPTGVYWGIIYNATSVGKECIAFVQMSTGAGISLQAAGFTYNFHAGGLGTVTRT